MRGRGKHEKGKETCHREGNVRGRGKHETESGNMRRGQAHTTCMCFEEIIQEVEQ